MSNNEHGMPPLEANRAFERLGGIVLGDQPLSAILKQVVELARQVLPVPTQASLTVIAAGEPSTVAFSGDTARALDERQYELDGGPCLDAARTGQLIHVPDTQTESRWPKYLETAVERGVRSSLSVPLPLPRAVTGALNFYAADTDPFDEVTTELARTFAGHAAVAVANAHLYETTASLAQQMQHAMASRATIEQAKGIIMRDRGCDADAAFAALVELSHETHLKLREIAERLVADVGLEG